MKRHLCILIGVVISLTAMTAQTMSGSFTAETNIPEAQDPRVNENSSASVRVAATEAQNVQLDICGKKYPMVKGPDGV